MTLPCRIIGAAVVVGAPLWAASACADEVSVLNTGILKGAFTPIATEIERQTGHKVTMSWGPSSGNSPEASPVRVRSGRFAPKHRRNVVVSGIGVAVKTGRPMPGISTTTAFRQALLAAKSVGYSEDASGTHFIKVVVPKLRLTKATASKGHAMLGRRFVGEESADGVVERGVQALSELKLEPGMAIVGRCPMSGRSSVWFLWQCRPRPPRPMQGSNSSSSWARHTRARPCVTVAWICRRGNDLRSLPTAAAPLFCALTAQADEVLKPRRSRRSIPPGQHPQPVVGAGSASRLHGR